MATSVLIALLLLAASASAPGFPATGLCRWGGSAQTSPALHSRGHGNQREAPTRATKGVSTLPENASGEFTLDTHGSVVQITIEHDRLTGYVTLMEQDTSLTLFFDKTSINGKHVAFTTMTVHGLSYVFAGAILRGDAEAPSLPGFYRLAGKLTTNRNGTSETKWVEMKSTPRLEDKNKSLIPNP